MSCRYANSARERRLAAALQDDRYRSTEKALGGNCLLTYSSAMLAVEWVVVLSLKIWAMEKFQWFCPRLELEKVAVQSGGARLAYTLKMRGIFEIRDLFLKGKNNDSAWNRFRNHWIHVSSSNFSRHWIIYDGLCHGFTSRFSRFNKASQFISI